MIFPRQQEKTRKVVVPFAFKSLKTHRDIGRLFANVQSIMTNAEHIKAFRLFELSRAESGGKDFPIQDWEREHLLGCVECRSVVEVFKEQFKGQFASPPDSVRPTALPPRFRAGDQIQIVGPGEHNGKSGVIESVVEPKTGDFVYRYRVRLTDGEACVLFGFEIARTAA
jgi:hypothetical protein